MLERTLDAFLTKNLRAQEIGHADRTLYEHLKGTHDLLVSWSNSAPVCRAGLFHSIYGTWYFQHQAFPLTRRNKVQYLIGQEAERLAYLFCVTKRPHALFDCMQSADNSIFDHFAERPIILKPAELDGLLEVEAANLIDQGGPIRGILRKLRRTRISQAAKRHIDTYLECPTRTLSSRPVRPTRKAGK